MKLRLWIVGLLLLLLLGGATTGFLLTREPAQAAEETAQAAAPAAGTAAGKGKGTSKEGRPRRERLVDQTPLQTARRLLPLAATAAEQALARQAERLANHDVDLAFTEALRSAAENAPAPSPELKALQEAKAAAEAAVADGEKLLKRLGAQLAKASGETQDRLEDQIEVAKAQLELDRDELAEASENLERVGGDPQARIRRLKAAHEAADRESAAATAAALPAETLPAHSLLARFKAWRLQRQKHVLLARAQQEAQAKIQRLASIQQRLAQRLNVDKEARSAAKEEASSLARAKDSTKEARQEALDTLKRFAQTQRRLSAMARRSQDERELAEVYGSWMTLVEGYRRTALHALMTTLLGIAGILAGVFLLNRLAEFFMRVRSEETLRMGTHRTVVKLVLRVLGLVAIVFVVVGMPGQTTTVLGLMGAGLTVALKDFIVAFFGWFVLMGRNGIRVGDWVEIKGVGGEVVEIGLLRTVILETGSWSDSGHPTGRRVAFVNSFAMEGHYFNFSTSGQWMWDELKVLIPPDQDPYAVLEGVQRLVDAETKAHAEVAEREWEKTARRYRVRAFSTTPGIQLVPTALGIELRARYITRAFKRHETRRGLYQAVVELMHGKRPPEAEAAK